MATTEKTKPRRKGGYIVVDKERCKACELCVKFCPQCNLKLSVETNARGFHPMEMIDEENCTACTNCALMCPEACIKIFRRG
jgi:2-oxoglutarate ferredoxin oxidoreductase subunit delta